MRLEHAGTEIGRWPFAATLALVTALTLPASEVAQAKTKRDTVATAPMTIPPPDPALAGPALNPSWEKHVYVVTDSVMLGAKPAFIKAMSDLGWQVTFTGRPALMIRKGLEEYVRQQSSTGPVAVVALGYNSLWEKDRHNFKRWSDLFDKSVEDMLAALKERGARKIVWVTLRELTPDLVSGGTAVSQLHKYAWYFPYVNERLRAIKARHPEMTIADWSAAAQQTGLTYDAIHLNPRGGELMTAVVKAAIGTDARPANPPPASPRPAPVVAAVQNPPPQLAGPEQPRATEPPRVAEPQAPPPAEPQASAPPPKKPGYRARREGMFALSKIDFATVVMLGDSLTERAQWSEITGCRFVANRGIGADDSAGVLRRLDAVTKLKPQAVFLMIGVNDVVSSVPTETIVENVRQTVKTLTDAGAQVYLMLVLPVTQGFGRKVNPGVVELDAAYVALARETNAVVVDFRSKMRTEDGFLRDELSLDGIHLSPAGYRIWRDAITPLVQKHCTPGPAPVARAVAPRSSATPAVVAAPELTTASIPAASAPPAPPVVARGQWIIQVGAYPEEERAKERIRRAQDLGKTVLANASPFTERIVKAGQELFRARFAGFDQSSAEAACSYFKRNAIDCVAVRN